MLPLYDNKIKKYRNYYMELFYPPFNEKSLPTILHLYEEDPEYFNRPECPYLQVTKDLFRIKPKGADFTSHLDENAQGFDNKQTIEEISELYRQMKAYGPKALSSDKSSDQNTYFRVSVILLEKLITLKERASALSSANEFVSEVLTIMQDTLNPDQVAKVMDRLKKYREKCEGN